MVSEVSPFSVDAVGVASLDRNGSSLDQNVCGVVMHTIPV